MICFPNCKINIGLNVISKRVDGFHDIETVFYPVQFSDALECIADSSEKNSDICITQSGNIIGCLPEDNICVKAYNLLSKHHKLPPVKIFLHKVIPVGSGLGGGSSDAAFTLKMLNDIFFLSLSKEQLHSYAAELGSDCAFFIYNQPSYAVGKGEILNPVSIDISEYSTALVIPPIHINTKNAYSTVVPKKPSVSLLETIKKPVAEWKHHLKNDFEEGAFMQYPQLKIIKEKLYEYGALYASMSGSGAAMYGIFHKKPDFRKDFTDCKIWIE